MTRRIKEVSKLHKNSEGRYETAHGHYYTSGCWIEALVSDDYHEVPYWTRTRVEVTLVNTMSRETILRQYLQTVREDYDVILLDCCPSLGMLTINALAASDKILIPIQAQFLSIKGLEQLLRTIAKVRRQINPGL